MQTGASALLAAASFTSLYGVVRFFDLFRRDPANEVEPQRIEFDPPIEMDAAPAPQASSAKPVAHEPQLTIVNIVEEVPVEDVRPVNAVRPEEEAAPAKARGRAKSPRKGSGRGNKASKDAVITPPDPLAEAKLEVQDIPEAAKVTEIEPVEEPLHPPVAPLFEPEPYVRQQQRAIFGRKAG